jgi:hypothetical protein
LIDLFSTGNAVEAALTGVHIICALSDINDGME